jgi:hypothetical protein
VNEFFELERSYLDAQVLFELAQEAQDEATLGEVSELVAQLAVQFEKVEFHKMLSEEADPNNAILTINAGAGGTESQDWAHMLLRMYQRWAQDHDFRIELIDALPGEEAGIKSATLTITGPYAYGQLKSEAGVHRLVRISLLIRMQGVIPLLPVCLSLPKLMMILRWLLILRTFASMSIEQVVKVARGSIPPTLRFVSRICLRGLWWPVSKSVRRLKIKTSL